MRNLSPRTQSTYVTRVSLFARLCGKSAVPTRSATAKCCSLSRRSLRPALPLSCHPAPGPRYPRGLACSPPAAQVSGPAQIHKGPAVPRLRGGISHRAILTAFLCGSCYTVGLGISAAVSLQPAAIDSRRMVLRVKPRKSRNDRYVMLSPRITGDPARLLVDCLPRGRVAVPWPPPRPHISAATQSTWSASRPSLRLDQVHHCAFAAMPSPSICSNPARSIVLLLGHHRMPNKRQLREAPASPTYKRVDRSQLPELRHDLLLPPRSSAGAWCAESPTGPT